MSDQPQIHPLLPSENPVCQHVWSRVHDVLFWRCERCGFEIGDSELDKPHEGMTVATYTDDLGRVVCLDCGWKGSGFELKAQACPVCDGRVADC